MATKVHNLLANLPMAGGREVFEELLRLGHVRIERILTMGEPDDVLYDQAQDEWVLLLQGEAGLWIDGEDLTLGPGDAVFIPAQSPHRVTAATRDPPCIWLAVHIERC
jgi:cupin 2 domain-containing protein